MYYLNSELMFLETSAQTGENIEETFQKCARSILTKIESGMLWFEVIVTEFEFANIRGGSRI